MNIYMIEKEALLLSPRINSTFPIYVFWPLAIQLFEVAEMVSIGYILNCTFPIMDCE